MALKSEISKVGEVQRSPAERSVEAMPYSDVVHDRMDTEGRRLSDVLIRQAALIELSYEPIFVWELGAGILDWNRGAENIFGYSAKELRGRPIAELFGPERPGEMRAKGLEKVHPMRSG